MGWLQPLHTLGCNEMSCGLATPFHTCFSSQPGLSNGFKYRTCLHTKTIGTRGRLTWWQRMKRCCTTTLGWQTETAQVCSAAMRKCTTDVRPAQARVLGGFRQKFTPEDAIGSHACSLEASMHVTNGIPLGSSLLLRVDTVTCV
jgi:hypothetical protein